MSVRESERSGVTEQDIDVSSSIKRGNPDDESLPLIQCVCGHRYKLWEVTLSIYPDTPTEMPCCGRRLYFSQVVTVHEVPK